jgi:tetratricopeptide (TPR) repeat protein
VLVVGGAPGEAFEPSPWESWLAAFPDYRAKEYAKAAEILAAELERHPDNANVLYNLACVESLGGRGGEALAHLQRAVELDPRAREWVRSDADLDAIRGEPGFPG